MTATRFRHNTDIGQNFIIDRSVIIWMITRAKLRAGDRVLEIGPGSGALTRGILTSTCSKLDAIEVDRRLEQFLAPIAATDARLDLHWADAVKFSYEDSLPGVTHLIANLPYHITTPLLWRVLEEYASSSSDLKYMLLMLQSEAASRVAAGAGHRESNPLSITVEAIASCARVARKVPRSSFYPAPRVDSAIIEIILGDAEARALVRDSAWRKLLAGSFMSRRKTLANNWGKAFGVPRGKCVQILASVGLGPLARPEELSLAQWLKLRDNPELASCANNARR